MFSKMFNKIKNWFEAEIVQPVISLYSFCYNNFTVTSTLSIVLIGLVCTINPEIAFPAKKEKFVAYEPEFYFNQGKMSSLILKENSAKNIVNCSYFLSEKGSFCNLHKPRKLIKVEGEYYSNSTLFFKDRNIVVTDIIFEDANGRIYKFTTSKNQLESWWKWLFSPTLFVRTLVLFWLTLIIFIFFIKLFKKQRKLNVIEKTHTT